MANELKISIIGDASSAYEALQKVNAAIGTSTQRAEAFTKALEQAEAQGLEFNAAIKQAATSLEEFMAQESAAAASTQTFSQSQQQVQSTVSHTVPQFAAASGALRELQGNFDHNVRAAERFLSTTLGLGPALQAAFPIVGAIAFGAVIFDTAERLDKFTEDAEALGRELGTDWLTAAVAQVSGLGEAVKQADKEIENINRHLDSIVQAQRGNQIELAGIMGGSSAEKFERAGQMQQDLQALKALEPAQKQAIEYWSKLAEVKTNQFGSKVTENPGGLAGAADAQKQLEVAKRSYVDLLAKEAELDSKIFNLNQAASADQDKKDKQQKFHEDPNERVDFETNRLIAEEAEREYKKITDAIEKEKKAHGDAVLQMARDNDRERELEQKTSDEILKTWEEGLKAQEEAQRKHGDAQVREAERQYQDLVRITRLQEQAGQITPKQAAQTLTAGANTAQSTEVAAAGRTEDQLTEIAQRGKNRREQIKQEELSRETQAYNRYFQQVSVGLNQSVDAWLRGNQRMSQAVLQAADNMAIGVINALMQMGEKWLAHEIMVRVLHLQTAATNRAVDAADKAAQLGMTIGTNVAIAQSNVAVAATLALAETANPAAAAAIFGIGEGFAAMAAFAGGTDYVPKTGMAVIHEGERITPRSENQQISRLLAGRGQKGGGGDIHYHDHSNFTGIDGASVENMYRENAQAGRREFFRQARLANQV